ncbi:hypothetical protein J113_02615 [Mycobacterium tuberculosis CAS/NITR204]|uniref:UDP-N-acetylglucosamine kinase n=1 Tax=Mycobacterium tuberculosis CAS/NITR204 TaxID=1310114 RepID=R4MEA9_MYCTX|nr:hypothetical protein J113_02615 [Mycobacterium tuberculosis CAS/NITR204]
MIASSKTTRHARSTRSGRLAQRRRQVDVRRPHVALAARHRLRQRLQQRWPDDPTSHAYQAAQVAADTRARLIDLGRPFIAETVFSHPSKLELIRTARTAGYTVVLHVLVIPEGLAVERVRHRVAAGGHDVPETRQGASPPAGRACRPGHHAGRRRHRL